MQAITQIGDEILRKTAQLVPDAMFGTKELQNIVDTMTQILDTHQDGIALAAPQISIPYRIFVIRYDRLTTSLTNNDTNLKSSTGVFINPEMVRTSRKSQEIEEGCLSIHGIYGKVYRMNRATVCAYTVDGIKFRRDGGGILAQAFQHEIDHLNGILFVDYTDDLYKINDNDTIVNDE